MINNYQSTLNKPSINGKELIGNLSTEDIGSVTAADVTTALGNYYTKSEIDAMIDLTPSEGE